MEPGVMRRSYDYLWIGECRPLNYLTTPETPEMPTIATIFMWLKTLGCAKEL